MQINKPEELNWIYHTLRQRFGVYLLENIVDDAKPYSLADVHEWGKEKELNQIYEKIKDFIKVRIFEAVEAGLLDRALAGEILKTYYYKPFVESSEGGGKIGDGIKKIVVEFVQPLESINSTE
jgi:hypothetical protein